MFNVRVYGLLINNNQEILVSDELIKGKFYTKFCGGGLEFGEGTHDCLIREFKEEMDLSVEIVEHLYTTDYYQPSLFNPQHQMISIYYVVRALEPIKIKLKETAFDFDETQLKKHAETGQTESFRFIPHHLFSPDLLSLPIDKIAAKVFKEKIAPK
jgi:ADP-ribose pyrophosphatase YjhB (NUDIX family)